MIDIDTYDCAKKFSKIYINRLLQDEVVKDLLNQCYFMIKYKHRVFKRDCIVNIDYSQFKDKDNIHEKMEKMNEILIYKGFFTQLFPKKDSYTILIRW